MWIARSIVMTTISPAKVTGQKTIRILLTAEFVDKYRVASTSPTKTHINAITK